MNKTKEHIGKIEIFLDIGKERIRQAIYWGDTDNTVTDVNMDLSVAEDLYAKLGKSIAALRKLKEST